ncbi:MAG: HPr family phosphocarrier protein, partial [Actinomycetia bacterium]|nr:HPr family phosphocarrier protein [Actinomycetes bacterium]
MITRDIEILNELGLHVRIAGKIVKEMKKFASSVDAVKDGQTYNFKNVTGVITTNAKKGDVLTFQFEGPDEEVAADTVVKLFADRFGEKGGVAQSEDADAVQESAPVEVVDTIEATETETSEPTDEVTLGPTEVAMGLIVGAGDSRSYCLEAITEAKDGNFTEARELIDKAVAAMVETHEVQTELIRNEMTGNPSEVSLLMVHAQDHLN